MIRIYFSSSPDPVRQAVPLAQACGIGRQSAFLFERSLERLNCEGPQLWSLTTDPGAADLFVYPYGYFEQPEERLRLEQLARAAGKPCLFFDGSDNCRPYEPAYGTVYRCSMFHEPQTRRRQAMPALCEDLLSGGTAEFRPRAKAARPVVGFCGYVSPRWKQWLRLMLGKRDAAAGHRLRRAAVAALRRCKRVETNFVLRDHYHGGALLVRDNPAEIARIRARFVQNILGSDYTLCVRGRGNFSLRFYETLSAGRIPLLIDSGGALPLADQIDWPRHCVIVPQSQLASAGVRLADFHASLCEQAFEELQRSNRALWDQWLNPLDFLKRVVPHLTVAAEIQPPAASPVPASGRARTSR